MEKVGVRELKSRLTHYLRIVERGESIIITVRGKPVARLIPLLPEEGASLLPASLETKMWHLVRQGIIEWQGGKPKIPMPVARNRSPKLLSDLVVEDRN